MVFGGWLTLHKWVEKGPRGEEEKGSWHRRTFAGNQFTLNDNFDL